MPSRRKPSLIHLIWALGGIAVGASVALLFVQKLSADWVEATGTWFGAVATVLALLWAVQTFRADQTHRAAAAAEELAASQRRVAQEREAVVANARQVDVEVRGGGGYGPEGKQKMTSVHLDVNNNTAHQVVMLDFDLQPPLVAKRGLSGKIRIAAGSTHTQEVPIEDIVAVASEFSGRASERFTAEIIYQLDGRTWSRASDTVPEQV